MASVPGNPAGVAIRQIGPVRTFIASGDRLENRAIFGGDETEAQIDDVLMHFAAHRANCVIEVNPANYYVDPPGTWEQRLLKRLLLRGCRIDGFRCVWCRMLSLSSDNVPARYRIERFGPEQLDRYIELSRPLEPNKQWTPIERAAAAHAGRYQYVAFADDLPCAAGTMIVMGETAYLAWWFTNRQHRGNSLHHLSTSRRTRDALDLGCRRVFSVTDFNFASPRNLQRCGFALAYNYLLVLRDPVPF
jgi:hypothetical protein